MLKSKEPLYLELSKNDRKWLATSCATMLCTPAEEKIKLHWKEEIRRTIIPSDNQILKYKIDEFECAFPNIRTLRMANRIVNSDDIHKYFRFLGDITQEVNVEGNLSHNVLVYRKISEIPYNDFLLSNEEVCAVKPVDLETGEMWGFGGIYRGLKFDETYFGKIKKTRYMLTHGYGDNGLVLVEPITEEEFNRYKHWYENVQNVKENPFKKRHPELEKILQERF